jgi:hypothetical protein
MKIYKHWVIEKQKIMIDGEEKEITCYGGSNISIEDARVQATAKAQKIERKIEGEKHVFDEYEAEIREEILRIIDDHSVITRNRYGASVLNTEKMMILDIDEPKIGFMDLFKKDKRSDKEKIFDMVRKLAATLQYQEYGFRLYETFQGARVIVLGKEFDPRDPATKKMMDEFNCDPLYTFLCIKQGCYRARLTPKPYRMKMRGYKVKFPREGDESEFQQWLSQYEQNSRGFCVCRFVEQIGTNYPLDDVVCLHDDLTGVNYRQPLA